MTNEEYIGEHRTEDVRRLALKKAPEGVDQHWCLQQIEGRQIAEKKLPQWAAIDGLWYPPHLSMEQCSSEPTALYKKALCERLLPQADRAHLTDLTGGFGIDFSYMAQAFAKATYIEQQPHLCDIASHNFTTLGLKQAEVRCADGCQALPEPDTTGGIIYLDPARRDNDGRKTVALEDCTPNLIELQDELLPRARYVIVKLSPMLDITQALRSLHKVTEVHVISVKNECKELLMVLSQEADAYTNIYYYCVNLPEETVFRCSDNERKEAAPLGTLAEGLFLYEPNASLLKAGCQDALAIRHGLQKLHPQSNLYLATEEQTQANKLPGRVFRITGWSDFSKKGLKSITQDLKQANITIRNFPTSVADLRKKLKLSEGGNVYLFATTTKDGKHVLIRNLGYS